MASQCVSREINGIATEVVVQNYADRVLVLVTQLGKVGNLIQASIPATTPLPPNVPDTLPAPPTAIHLTPLLGASPSEHLQTLHALYAAQIATLVWVTEAELVERRSVVVGIALEKVVGEGEEASKVEREVFLGVMDMLREVLNRGV